MSRLRSERTSPRHYLLIESGAQAATERFLQHVYTAERECRVDVLTCYRTYPENFDTNRGRMFYIHEPEIAQRRSAFICRLLAARYSVLAVVSTGSPVLTKWKWLLVAFTRARVLIVTENSQYFLLESLSGRVPRLSAVQLRLGAELLVVPFSMTFLLVYAGAAHFRRLFR